MHYVHTGQWHMYINHFHALICVRIHDRDIGFCRVHGEDVLTFYVSYFSSKFIDFYLGLSQCICVFIASSVSVVSNSVFCVFLKWKN